MYILVLIGTNSISQNENNIWYFGENAGLDFSSGSPVALTDGAMYTLEGCTSVSDSDGKLLFYTNGMTVWNNNHAVMINGTGLLGGNSSSQSAIIVKQPGSPNLYYIFTAPDFSSNMFCYSIVDMNLDGGLGAVTSEKNKPLFSKASEKITAIKHANNTDYWIVTRNAFADAAYYSFHLTCDGLIETPIVSEIGIKGYGVHAGCLKGSPKSDRIAAAYGGDIDVVEVFDFDNSTGILSNPIQLTGKPYGVEFSSNNNLLYVLESYSMDSCLIFQYDLQAGGELEIQDSKLLVGVNPSHVGGSLQIGPDKKIYVAQYDSEYLGVINNPDVFGVGCDYDLNGVNLAGKSSTYGLPNWHYSSDFKVDLGNDTSICIGETLLLDAESSGNTYLWQDGSTISSYIVNQQGTYSVEVNLNECVISDTIQITEDICSSTLEIPNVFTPDNDGVNDYFIPISTGEVSSMKTVIYNRWGRKVFETDNPMIEWSGESSSSGTYFWVISFKDGDEYKKVLNGHLTLIR